VKQLDGTVISDEVVSPTADVSFREDPYFPQGKSNVAEIRFCKLNFDYCSGYDNNTH
jgi:hypothetical protein